MGLVSAKELLMDAQRGHYAIPAFNVENMETIQGVILAAEAMGHPVIIQTTPSSVSYAGLDFFVANLKAALQSHRVTAALHLDHGSSYELVVRAMKAGYTSIMIDGSKLPLPENIALTKRVTELGGILRIPVEAELGCIGGKEDETESAKVLLTDCREAVVFVNETGVDSLAVAIGTAHGFYRGTPRIDLDRLREIREQVTIPLVLHGTSGVDDKVVKTCIKEGICKVNYATDLRVSFTKAVQQSMAQNPDNIDPKVYLKAGREAVAETARQRIRLCMNKE